MPEGRGRLIAGQYRLVEEIGRGGFAVVWRARDERLHRDVAAKRLFLPAYSTVEQRSEQRRRTLQEARSAARLDHPGVVTVHDVVEDGDDPWIIMEYVDGRSLGELVRTHGPLPPERVADIGLQLLDALRAAHRAGVLHRDVKPGNVLLAGRRVVLGDFGLATVEGDPVLTQSGVVMGAPAYLAPERARGEPAVAASDLWSLGATMFYAVEGRRPFAGGNPNAVLHSIITEDPAPAPHAGPLGPVLDGLLRKDAGDRLGADATAALLAAVADQAGSAGRTGRAGQAAGRSAEPGGHGTDPPADGTGPAPAGPLRPGRAGPGARTWHGRHRTMLIAAPVAALALALLTVPHRTLDNAWRTRPRPRPASTVPRLLATLPAGPSEIYTVAFSPDGRALAAGGADHAVRLWNLADRRLTTTLTGHAYDVFAAAFSPDGRTLATAGYDGRVLLWSGDGRARIATLDTHGNGVSALTFSPDGAVLASAGDAVRLWSVPGHRAVATLPAHGESMFTAAFAPHGTTLATAGTWAIRLWDTARPARPVTVTRLTSLVVGMAFSPDGRTLAAGGYDGRVRLWDVATHRMLGSLPDLPGRVNGVAFSPDGRILACAGGDTVLLWDALARRALTTLPTRTGVVDSVAFAPDGRILATAGDDAIIRLWSLH
ncbi:serine/threonine protein kinase [Actinoallomurus spadix]|uniref:Protein kinase domain-containing protein n=1 Tax=Actinoallomurus spadix TaxID=79912 RepID=A0ABN0W0I4_9ACTN|nr:serine/threonine-protein kinase [Actinoallomurus spadix]MCO5988214.1 serine/threonine protein kinase [Actinoallomurus spadix]